MTHVENLRGQFDIKRISPSHWRGNVSDQFMVGRVPSGGYVTWIVLACVTGELRAASQEPPLAHMKRAPNAHPDVLSANIHFMASTLPGPFRCRINIIRSGKTTSTVQASLFQRDKETIHCLCTCGDLRAAIASGPNLQINIKGGRASVPSLPPFESCVRLDAGDNTPQSIRSRVILRVSEAAARQYKNCRAVDSRTGLFNEEMLQSRVAAVNENLSAEYSGYCQFANGAPARLSDAPLFLDASVPPILGAYVTGWVPSVNWTVQFKTHPAPGRLRFRFTTSSVVGGFLEEDGALWDSEGKLVALSRQLAMVGVSQATKHQSKI